MICETGRVVAVEPSYLVVETIRQSTCSSCSAQKGCGTGLLNKIGAGKAHHLTVARGKFEQTAIAIGDQVDISVPELMVVVGAAVVYLLPLLTLMVGMVAAEAVFVTEVAAALGAVGGLFVGVFLVRLHALWLAGKPEYQPVVSAHTAVVASVAQGDVQAVQIH